jgi:hypothetical protein
MLTAQRKTAALLACAFVLVTAHPSSGTQAGTTAANTSGMGTPHRGYTLQIGLMATLGLVAPRLWATTGRPTILVICQAAGAKAIWLTSASFRK